MATGRVEAFSGGVFAIAITLREDSDPREVAGITRSFAPGVPLYSAGTLLAFVSSIARLAVFARDVR